MCDSRSQQLRLGVATLKTGGLGKPRWEGNFGQGIGGGAEAGHA